MVVSNRLIKAIAIASDTWAWLDQCIQSFHQARLVRITHGRLAIWLDPFGMLDPQIVVNLFPQVRVRMELVKHNWFAYFGATAIACAAKIIGQKAMKIIVPKATSSVT